MYKKFFGSKSLSADSILEEKSNDFLEIFEINQQDI